MILGIYVLAITLKLNANADVRTALLQTIPNLGYAPKSLDLPGTMILLTGCIIHYFVSFVITRMN